MALIPIVDPKKRTTDPKVLYILQNKGLNADFVEFFDYNRDRPYEKLYKSYETDEMISVFSGLPMVRKTDGSKLIPGFELESNGKYWIKNNLFEGYASQTGEIHLAAVNDQPFGAIAGDESHWTPVLKVGNEIVNPIGGASLLDVDPINPNMFQNTLEWDYGVCKRRVRLVQGRFRGSWIFDKDPGADVRIDYNKVGRLNLRLGQAYDRDRNIVEVQLPTVQTEFIPASAWTGRTAPITVGDSLTVYPDASPETNTVDGDGYINLITADWTALVASTNYYINADSTNIGNSVGYVTASSAGNYQYLYRSIYLFETSALTVDATIISAVLSIRGPSKFDQNLSDASRNIVSSNPASNTALVASDMGTLGSDVFSDGITYTNWNTSGYNDFILNAGGLSEINKAGISKFGARLDADVTATAPAIGGTGKYTTLNAYFSDGGDGYKPKLVVTYTLPAANLFMNTYRRRRT